MPAETTLHAKVWSRPPEWPTTGKRHRPAWQVIERICLMTTQDLVTLVLAWLSDANSKLNNLPKDVWMWGYLFLVIGISMAFFERKLAAIETHMRKTTGHLDKLVELLERIEAHTEQTSLYLYAQTPEYRQHVDS